MIEKYFMHRIQINNGVENDGIEVHDTKNDAIRSFWGRMKTGYGNPQNPGMTYVSCKITDANGAVVEPYNLTWVREDTDIGDKYFFHHIRLDGETFAKDIDVLGSFDSARSAYAAQMEYGYDNPQFPNVSLVSCEITDKNGIVMTPFSETWVKPDPEPEPEAE